MIRDATRQSPLRARTARTRPDPLIPAATIPASIPGTRSAPAVLRPKTDAGGRPAL